MTPEGLELIRRNEGCKLHAYRDSVGVITIGFGHTGDDVYEGQNITQAEAEALFNDDIAKFASGVMKEIGTLVPTTDEQGSAMVSLAYNVGMGNFRKSSVLRHHRAGEWQAAADAFLLWDKAGGRVLEGLARRRQEEADMYLDGSPE